MHDYDQRYYEMRKFLTIALISFVSIVYAQNTTNNTNNTNTKKAKLPNGFEKVSWGTLLSKAKSNVKGKISFSDDKTLIVSKIDDITYYYGFFHIDLEKMKQVRGADKIPKDAPDEGKLFYVAIEFPYVDKDLILKKITTRFGKPSTENILDNQGSISWDSDKTILVLWVDKFENKPYSRRITYVSKDIAKEVNTYYDDFFKYKEKNTIRKLLETAK